MRTVVRTLIAGFLALAGPVLAAPAALAHAQEVQQQSFRTDRAFSHQLTISIDEVNPSFAKPDSTVTVSGTITNHTGSPLWGVQVQLLSQTQQFTTRSDMDTYAAGGGDVFPQQTGAPYIMKGSLHSGATAHWSASFTAAQAGFSSLSTFGVYPLEAQAEYPDGTASGTERTFLPFWPGNGSAVPLNTAWVWPLIDQPQQGPCPQTVATDSLAASLNAKGRLGTLLAAGQLWALKDHLTWAVDPALLSDANVMTHPYKVDTNSLCHGSLQPTASKAAVSWLSSLRAKTAGEPMFLTPYADSDVAALTHAGLEADLRTAYRLGESVAREILSRPFGMNGRANGADGSPSVGWPANGTADASVVASLADTSGISTVMLKSGELRSTAGLYDNALGMARTGTGRSMPALLADSELTSILGSASAASPAGAQFAAAQDFLAQTAMITAEAPFYKPSRSLVIVPPRRWNPSAAEATQLLSMTFAAPWLKKAALSSLAGAASHLKASGSLPASQVAAGELAGGYLDEVRSVDSNVAVYKDLLYQPGADLLQSIDAAAAATESSAWRGDGEAAGRTALTKLAAYAQDKEDEVRILTGTKLLLGGVSGPAPVSVQNAGQLPVQVRIVVTLPANSQLSIGNLDKLIVVQPLKTTTVTMTLHSTAIGTTQMQLQLVTKNWLPLSGPPVPLSVQVTRYGRALLVLIGAALGVLVLASVARWMRRLNDGRAEGRSGGTG